MSSYVLAVDNDPMVLGGLLRLAEDTPIEVETATSGIQGIDLVTRSPDRYRAVLLDYEMPGMNGDEVARRMREINPNLKIIMLSGTEDEEVVKSCYAAGAERFVLKAQDSSKIRDILLSVVSDDEASEIDPDSEKETALQNAILIDSTLKMKGHSRAMANVARVVKKVSASNENVLIQGESGVGKELVARGIHANSPRAGGPFIAINCGAIPKELLESELFGHEKGAFTSAVQSKKGKFLLANNGTLFLDEIGDLELPLQVKLLRALQERTIEPVGSQMSIKVNIRIVAATHRNLADLVAKGLFREDLYYRLKVFPVTIAPLRERPEDIEPIVHHIISLKEEETGTKRKISDAAMRAFKSLPWPGNVRQLEAAVKYAFLNSTRVIQVDSIDPELLSAKQRFDQLAKQRGLMSHEEFTKIVLEMEKSLLEDAMKMAGNVKSRAAELLGISHQAMNYRRRKLGLDAEPETEKSETKNKPLEV
ncbi:MAG: sigma-54-dependent Fis family transcriptional regulator [Bdellovibrionaceae bacterium]|nr:sigma-54-dependent Fis family transcriptional regulator [Pseudobdellovibrionaceae bacterium]